MKFLPTSSHNDLENKVLQLTAENNKLKLVLENLMKSKEIIYAPKLSPAEARVKDLVIQGLSTEAVGVKLGLAKKTIKFHLTHIYKAEGVKSRAELIVKNFRQGLAV